MEGISFKFQINNVIERLLKSFFLSRLFYDFVSCAFLVGHSAEVVLELFDLVEELVLLSVPGS